MEPLTAASGAPGCEATPHMASGWGHWLRSGRGYEAFDHQDQANKPQAGGCWRMMERAFWAIGKAALF